MQLTQAERNELRAFANTHGRRWKAALQTRWEHANCSPVLQRLRNKIGPSGLVTIRQADLRYPPTTREHFEAATPIMPDVVAETCLGKRQHNLTDDQRAWFVKHVDTWTRWFHANNAEWKRSLESEGDQGRDQLYVWVNHWLDSYLLDPERYQKQHPIAALTP
jgi:hypothetical protein